MKAGFFKRLFLALTGALLIAPAAAMLFGYTGRNLENRPLAAAPKLTTDAGLNLEFPSDFDAWFSDRFGLREEYVTALNCITVGVFSDTLNDKVNVGRHGCLFYSPALNDYLGRELMSGGDVARAARVLSLQSEYAESLGAKFIFTVAPNKSTVYPEYMPGYLVPAGSGSNREALASALRAFGVTYIDLASELTVHKSDGALYYEHDTHWNARGSLTAYNALMRCAADGFSYDDYSDRVPTLTYDYAGDLHYFLFPAVTGALPRLDYGDLGAYTPVKRIDLERDLRYSTTSTKNTLDLMYFGDSFTKHLFPFIAPNAGSARFSTVFPYAYADFAADPPDAIIVELVERNIPNLLTGLPEMTAPERLLDSSCSEVAVGAYSINKYNRAARLVGCFDPSLYDPATMRILVQLTQDGRSIVYEAFPILDDSMRDAAATLYGDSAALSGFGLTLGSLDPDAAVRVFVGGA